jgi:hypothetical protein
VERTYRRPEEPSYSVARPRFGNSMRSRLLGVLAFVLSFAVGFAVVLTLVSGAWKSLAGRPAAHASSVATRVVVATPSPTPPPFDPSVGAPLPDNRIVAAYGIVGGDPGGSTGPATTLPLLQAYLPTLQQLGQQYAALDPTHPVLLGLDLVVNVFQGGPFVQCIGFEWCASWTDSDTIQTYVDFCKQHNLLLFFDVQLGTEPVADAVTTYLLPYLQKYTFTELALDTEFHFPDTAWGRAQAIAYNLGSMNASEINWAIQELALISVQYKLPRKVLVVHQWNSAVLPDKGGVKLNPNVSLVLQSDGFGGTDNKLGDYQIFVQQALWQYGGYKLFRYLDTPMQTPQQIMQVFPQPLFISYQ